MHVASTRQRKLSIINAFFVFMTAFWRFFSKFVLIYTHKTIDAFELSIFNNFNLNKTKLIFETTIIFDNR